MGVIFGHKRTLIYAAAWWVLWHLVSGFLRNLVGLCIARGLAGAGGGSSLQTLLPCLESTFHRGGCETLQWVCLGRWHLLGLREAPLSALFSLSSFTGNGFSSSCM